MSTLREGTEALETEPEMEPLVTIVTPSYNQARFLEDTIQSVLNQDYHNIEYLVMDGASTDGSVPIIRKYQGRIAFWASEKDHGQTDAIMKGFQRARGKYITWLCSDDIIEPSMISTSVAFLEKCPEVVMTYGDRIRYDSKGNVIGYHRYCDFRPWLLRWGFAIPQETCLIRKDAYDRSGGLDRSLEMAMDFDLFCKLSRVGPIKHIPAFLGRFRSHEKNKSTVFDREVFSGRFQSGGPKELTDVYFKHFKKDFPVSKWKRASQLTSLLALYDRRSGGYKSDKALALQVRSL